MDLINFVNITTELNLKKDIETFLGIYMTINAVLTKFQGHPSIKQIRETFNNDEDISFEEVTED